MKKLKLNIESISVQSFETDALHTNRGTVHGHEPSFWTGLGPWCYGTECTCPNTE